MGLSGVYADQHEEGRAKMHFVRRVESQIRAERRTLLPTAASAVPAAAHSQLLSVNACSSIAQGAGAAAAASAGEDGGVSFGGGGGGGGAAAAAAAPGGGDSASANGFDAFAWGSSSTSTSSGFGAFSGGAVSFGDVASSSEGKNFAVDSNGTSGGFNADSVPAEAPK